LVIKDVFVANSEKKKLRGGKMFYAFPKHYTRDSYNALRYSLGNQISVGAEEEVYKQCNIPAK